MASPILSLSIPRTKAGKSRRSELLPKMEWERETRGHSYTHVTFQNLHNPSPTFPSPPKKEDDIVDGKYEKLPRKNGSILLPFLKMAVISSFSRA